MEKMRLLAFLLIACVISLALACRSSSSSDHADQRKDLIENVHEDYEDDLENEDNIEDEDIPDETVDDISLDDEDFDLMCEFHEKSERNQRQPDFIIIGAKKGGTRALIEFLKLHPSVKAAGPEIHYFDNHYEEGLDWYISRMPAVEAGRLITEKTPGYFHTPKVPRRIKSMDPNIKLLLIVRDPVKRLVSDYNQFRTKNLDQNQTYPELEELVFTANGEVNVQYPPVKRSIYHEHMKRWLRHFPIDQIHVVNGDSFIVQPWIELEKIERFLQIDSVITENNFFFNSTKGFYCGRDIRIKGVWSCVKEKCLSKAKGRPKPPLKEGTVNQLTEYFRAHNSLFYKLINQTFSWPI